MSYSCGTGTDDNTLLEDIMACIVFYGSIIGIIVFAILYCLGKI